MKKCFVCQEDLTLQNQCPCDLDDCGKTHVEFIFNADGSAHAACVWRAAKLMVEGFVDECPNCGIGLTSGCCIHCGEVYLDD